MKINFFKLNLLMLLSAYFLSMNAEMQQIDKDTFLKLKERFVLLGDTKVQGKEDQTLPDFDTEEHEYFIAHLMAEKSDLYWRFTSKEDAEQLLTLNMKIGIVLVNWYGKVAQKEGKRSSERKEAQQTQADKAPETWWDTAAYYGNKVYYYV